MIKHLRLVDGSDVIADVEIDGDDGELIRLHNPIRIVMAPTGQLAFIPMCLLSKKTDFTIFLNHVIFQDDPDEELANLWREKFGSGISIPTKKLVVPNG